MVILHSFKRRRLSLFISGALIFLGIFLVSRAVFAVDQIKTTETFIFQETSSVSTAINRSFDIYIGDNITGVTNAVKSVYFVVSGVYTGNGTLNLQINSDAATSKTFTLPNVGTTPTPFEILYKDEWNKIQPTSAGTYTHTLNVTPSGVTIYGLGAKLQLTYRYVPGSCDDGTNQKHKTVKSFVGESVSSFTSQINKQFNIYIGDSLTGVTAPAVKSVYFNVFGVYTGNGSLQLQIDSTATSTQTFTLPNVGTTPTPFEFLYKDPTTPAPGVINPTSSGSYNYTLNIIPSGVTIYGFGATATVTYRYAPPSCGGNPFGDLVSAVFDTAPDGAAYNSFLWKGTIGTGKVRFQLATSESATGPWSYIGGASCNSSDWYDSIAPDTPVPITCAGASHNNQRYFKYKIRVCKASNCTDTTGTSPQVDDIVVSWSP